MENKEKQIEEMAYIIENAFKVYFGANDLVEPEDFPYQAKDLAKELLESYQPKLPEDSVVLSKEDYRLWNVLKKTWASDDKEVSAEDMLETLKNTKELGSKEMAEKLITKIKQFLNNVETVVEDDKYSLYPEIGYKCSEVDDFLDEIEKTIQG